MNGHCVLLSDLLMENPISNITENGMPVFLNVLAPEEKKNTPTTSHNYFLHKEKAEWRSMVRGLWSTRELATSQSS